MNPVIVTNDFATRKFLHYPPDEGFARWKISGTLAKGSFARWKKGKTPAKSCFAQWKIVRYPPDDDFARRLFLDRYYRHAIVCRESTRRQSLGRCAKRTLKAKRGNYSCARRLTTWFLSFYCPILRFFLFFISLFLFVLSLLTPYLIKESSFYLLLHSKRLLFFKYTSSLKLQ